MGGGIIGLIIALLVMCASLYAMVRLLHSLVMGQAKACIMRGTNMNDYLAILLGFFLTIIVQSSSVTTSALTPLVGIGVLPVHKMLPMTLGANIGTTFTSMFAALAVMKFAAIQIAFCHLMFNIIGMLIWFPFPPARRVIVKAACLLGFYASYWRLVPLIYILVMFLAVPLACLAISLLYGVSVAAGIVVTIIALGAVGGFVFWWVRLGGCYKAGGHKHGFFVYCRSDRSIYFSISCIICAALKSGYTICLDLKDGSFRPAHYDSPRHTDPTCFCKTQGLIDVPVVLFFTHWWQIKS